MKLKIVTISELREMGTWGPHHEVLVAVQPRKCDNLPMAYSGHSMKMALETGPMGTRFHSHPQATTFVSL